MIKNISSCIKVLSHTNNPIDFAVLLNGDLQITDRLLRIIKDCRIIASDGGIAHADKLKVVPELWIGDFDSTDHTLLQQWSSIKRISYLPNKDMSDGEIAIHKALQLGAKNIILVGAISGQRFDYALQHITLAIYCKKQNINVALTSGIEECFVLIPGKHYFDFPKNSIFSIVALSDIKNLTITGAKYTLSNYSMSLGSSRTCSNVAKDKLTIVLDHGSAIIISRPYDLQRF
ncbi:thiamine diphosphokinase [Candidatus Liberibacter solanacearum]|uniref:Thiamine diphosphokinase n=1 Tax=Candidatus Liberibacter solanacearum TaxID=556287 RepID=A0A1V2N730_9HYPH|nr:thiamine diphosphokinase [Candidatus Liberibacter solanacearum]ONI58425.1 thiamine diphosphokinase [Candidatus Liberibacter solanacearum]ONI59033.1 thiamine pyrophosphokinase [Candidatus Liberibacter solanacearum]